MRENLRRSPENKGKLEKRLEIGRKPKGEARKTRVKRRFGKYQINRKKEEENPQEKTPDR